MRMLPRSPRRALTLALPARESAPAVAAVAAALVSALLLLSTLLACERPPVGEPPGVPPPPPGEIGPIPLHVFLQDRPAIAGRWYDYNPDGHTIEPEPLAWIVAGGDGAGGTRHAAFRITSIYEADAAESGLFTLGVALHDGTAWGAETEWVTPRNVKLTGAMCVDLFSKTERECVVSPAGVDDDWQLRLTHESYYSPSAGIAVSEPAVHLRSVAGTEAFGDVAVARLDGVTALDALPEPSTLEALGEADAESWQLTDWDFGRLAPDLPRAGMAIGGRVVGDGFTATGDVIWLHTSRFDLMRLQVAPVTEGDIESGLRFSYSIIEVNRETWNCSEVVPEAVDVDVAMPAAGGAQYLSFRSETLIPDAADTAGTAWPFLPPLTTRYDVILERPTADQVRLVMSPATSMLNATQLGFDEEQPPVVPPEE